MSDAAAALHAGKIRRTGAQWTRLPSGAGDIHEFGKALLSSTRIGEGKLSAAALLRDNNLGWEPR